jgi:hypothetical protein
VNLETEDLTILGEWMIEDPCLLETTLTMWECEKHKKRTE